MKEFKEKRLFLRKIRRIGFFVLILFLVLADAIFLISPPSVQAVNCSSNVSYNLSIVGPRYSAPGVNVTLYAKVYKIYEERSKYEDICVPVVDDLTENLKNEDFIWKASSRSEQSQGKSYTISNSYEDSVTVYLNLNVTVEGQKLKETSATIGFYKNNWITNIYEGGYFGNIKYYPLDTFSVDSNVLKINSKRTEKYAGFYATEYYREDTHQWEKLTRPDYLWGYSTCQDLDKIVVNLDNNIFSSPISGSSYSEGLSFVISEKASPANSNVMFIAYYSEKDIFSEQKEVTDSDGKRYRGNYYTCVVKTGGSSYTITTSFSINILNIYSIVLPPRIEYTGGGVFTDLDASSGKQNSYFNDSNQKYYKNISINQAGSGSNNSFLGLEFTRNIVLYDHKGKRIENPPSKFNKVFDDASVWQADGKYILGIPSAYSFTLNQTKIGKGWLDYSFNKSKVKFLKILKCVYLPPGQRKNDSASECTFIAPQGLKVEIARDTDPNPYFRYRIAVWNFWVQSRPTFPSSCDNSNTPYGGSNGLFYYYLNIPGIYDVVNKIKFSSFGYIREIFSNPINIPEKIVQRSLITIEPERGCYYSQRESLCTDFIRVISSLGDIFSPDRNDKLCGGDHCLYVEGKNNKYIKEIFWPKNYTEGISLPPNAPISSVVYYLLPFLEGNGYISNVSSVESLSAIDETEDKKVKTYFPVVEYEIPRGCFRRYQLIVKGDVYSAKGLKTQGIIFKPLSEDGGSLLTISSASYTLGSMVYNITNNPDLKYLPFYNFETKEIFSSSTNSAESALADSILLRRIYDLKNKSPYLYSKSSSSGSGIISNAIIKEGFLSLENLVINLNPKETTDFLKNSEVDKSRPNGRIWVVEGNLKLENITYKGNGAIIVTGAVKISGQLKKDIGDPNASLTLISLYNGDNKLFPQSLDFQNALKAIEITDDTSSVNGFLFAPFGYVSTGFGGKELNFNGAIVASKIHFGRSAVMRFTYDDKAVQYIPREISKLFESRVMVR